MSSNASLENIALHHTEDVQRLESHPEIVANTTLPDPYPENGAEKWIKHVLPRRKSGKQYVFAVINPENELVGVTGLDEVNDETATLAYWIGKPFWNRGYATGAGEKTLQFAFEELGLDLVFARTLQDNASSRRVLKKLGFKEGPIETIELPKWEEEDEIVHYELSRSQWEEHSA